MSGDPQASLQITAPHSIASPTRWRLVVRVETETIDTDARPESLFDLSLLYVFRSLTRPGLATETHVSVSHLGVASLPRRKRFSPPFCVAPHVTQTRYNFKKCIQFWGPKPTVIYSRVSHKSEKFIIRLPMCYSFQVFCNYQFAWMAIIIANKAPYSEILG